MIFFCEINKLLFEQLVIFYSNPILVVLQILLNFIIYLFLKLLFFMLIYFKIISFWFFSKL